MGFQRGKHLFLLSFHTRAMNSWKGIGTIKSGLLEKEGPLPTSHSWTGTVALAPDSKRLRGGFAQKSNLLFRRVKKAVLTLQLQPSGAAGGFLTRGVTGKLQSQLPFLEVAVQRWEIAGGPRMGMWLAFQVDSTRLGCSAAAPSFFYDELKKCTFRLGSFKGPTGLPLSAFTCPLFEQIGSPWILLCSSGICWDWSQEAAEGTAGRGSEMGCWEEHL